MDTRRRWQVDYTEQERVVTEKRETYGTQRRKFALTVMGNPIPKGRVRVASHAYTPQATRDYETLVRGAASLVWTGCQTIHAVVETWPNSS